MTVILGVTGSIAAQLTGKMVNDLEDMGHTPLIVITEAAWPFLPKSLRSSSCVYRDKDERRTYKNQKLVLHIELVKWSQAFIIAPCTVNTLAKLSTGLCDNLLTSCARAWNKPLIIAPAANTNMYNHPATREACLKLSNWGHVIVPPQEKTLFCGDTGIGAMAQIDDIVRCLDYAAVKSPL